MTLRLVGSRPRSRRFRRRLAIVSSALLVGALVTGSYPASAEDAEPTSGPTAAAAEPTPETTQTPEPDPSPKEPSSDEPSDSPSDKPSDSPSDKPSDNPSDPPKDTPAPSDPTQTPEPTGAAPDDLTTASALGAPGVLADVGTSAVTINVTKTNDAGPTTQPGDNVTFTVTITNSGTSPITITSITDSIDGGPESDVCASLIGTTLGPGESVDCMFTEIGYAPDFGETKENTVRVEARTATPAGSFLVADEDTIDNASDYYLDSDGNLATWDSDDVNDGDLSPPSGDSGPNPARRTPLEFFADPDNIGTTITIQSGDASDPGLFSIDDPPRTTENLSDCSGTGLWSDRDPGTGDPPAGDGDPNDGLENFIGDPSSPWPHNVGPGLGTGSDPEKCLDKVPGNALDTVAEIEALVGQQVCILAKDSDVSFDPSPDPDILNLQGAYLGVAAFRVDSLLYPDDPDYPDAWGDNQLPALVITILDPLEVCGSQTVEGTADSSVTIEQEPTGSLDVIKMLLGEGEPPPGTTFTVEIDCDDDDFDRTLTFNEDGMLTSGNAPITGIPVGTQCEVEETGDGGADEVTYAVNGGSPSGDPPTVTITENQTVTVTVNNTFEVEEQRDGSLEVDKVVTGDGEPAPGTTFTVEVDCEGEEFDETLVFDENGDLVSGTNPITGIPLGTECTVEETDDGGADSVTYDPNPPTVTIETEGETVTVTVTNTFENGRDDDDDDDDDDGDGDGGDGDGDDGDEEAASLPSTGGGALGLLKVGAWLLLMGSALVLSTRRSDGEGSEALPVTTDDDDGGEGAHASRPSTSSGAAGLLKAWVWPIVLGSTLLIATRQRRSPGHKRAPGRGAHDRRV